MRDMEPKEAIFCNKQGFKWKTQVTKTFSLQFVLHAKYTKTRTQHNCHQRDEREFIQQLMGAASELHSQTLCRVPIEGGEEGSKKQSGQGHHKTCLTEITDCDSWDLAQTREHERIPPRSSAYMLQLSSLECLWDSQLWEGGYL